MRAESEGASATLSYLFDELDRPYAASYEATRAGESTSAVFALMTTDHGDVIGLTDAGANQFGRYAYGPFGEAEEVASRAAGGVSAALAAEITSLQPLRYAGYDYDAWSNTYYLQARYYDPATKQFLSKDPAEADGEESAYQYCAGDPINQDDPDGEWAQVVAAKIIGGALVGAMEGHAWYGAGAAWKSRPFRRGFVKRFKKNWKWKDSVREARFGAAVGAVVGPGSGRAVKWGGKMLRRTKWGSRALDVAAHHSGRVRKFAQRSAGRLAKRYTSAGFRNAARRADHFKRHGGEFAKSFRNANDYEKAGRKLASRRFGVQRYRRPNGDTAIYHKRSNSFAVRSSDNHLRTYYRPRGGEKYVARDAAKHGAKRLRWWQR